MHEVLVNHLGGLSLPRKSVVRLTDFPDMTLDVYRGRKTTLQQHQQSTGVRCPLFAIVLDMHTRLPSAQSYHKVMQLQPHQYLHVRQKIVSAFRQC